MSFLNRVGNLLKQNVCKSISSVSSASSPSLSQAIRCMSSSSMMKLFVGGISFQVDEVSLSEAFSQYGSVIEARVFMDNNPRTTHGYGFVTYDTMEAAFSAIHAFDGQEFQGRKIRVTFATEEPHSGVGYGEGGGYCGGGSNYGGYDSQGGGYGRGGNQGSGNYSGGDENYGDVSNGGGNQFSGGGVGGYGHTQVPLGGD